jgi:hypothetical protein
VLRDHIQFSDDKAVINGGTRPTCFVPDEGNVMAQVLLEFDAGGTDLENVARTVFHNCVVTIRARQAALNRLVCSGRLCNPQRDQQGRYNYQQQCSLHGILEDSRLAAV